MSSDEAGMGVGDLEVFQRRVLDILQQGRAGTTMCPSDVARKLHPADWRALMPQVREAAFSLAAAGLVEVTQRGVVVDDRTVRGAIRVRAVRPEV